VPSVSSRPVEPQDTFVIVASDGLWKVATDEDAVAHVLSLGSVTGPVAANSLMDLCKERYKTFKHKDNVTVAVVYLNPPAPPGAAVSQEAHSPAAVSPPAETSPTAS